MKIAIIQSCYIPWKGFFDLIGRCDEYVIFDDAQYVKRHWHNRNKIKTANGIEWLTIPVVTKGRYEQSIQDVEIEKPWADRHWRSIELAYAKAPFFRDLAPTVQSWYQRAAAEPLLTNVNELFLREIVTALNLNTKITRDNAYPKHGRKTERLLGIAEATGATEYLSGPSAKAYFSEPDFNNAGIAVEWMDYSGYSEYPQVHNGFDHAVSVLDMMFNIGSDQCAAQLMSRRTELIDG